MFEYTWQELELWLRCLDKVEEDAKELVIQFLEPVTTVVDNIQYSVYRSSFDACCVLMQPQGMAMVRALN